MEYTELEKRCISYLSKRPFANIKDVYHDLMPEWDKEVKKDERVKTNRDYSFALWDIINNTMSKIAIELGTNWGDNRNFVLKDNDQLGLTPVEVIEIANTYDE